MTKQQDKTYTQAEIDQRLSQNLPGWEFRDGWIRRKYKTGGWQHTMLLTGAIGYIADAACHHPDLAVSFGEVHVKLMTHSADGITDKDFAVAERIEQHATWLPGADSPLDGYEEGFKKKWTR